MPEILLPTASKQNAIHEDVKQLKESSGVGKKYVPRIFSIKGSGAVEFTGFLDGITFGFESGYNSDVTVSKIEIDGENIGSFFFRKEYGNFLNVKAHVNKSVSISLSSSSGISYLSCRVRVDE